MHRDRVGAERVERDHVIVLSGHLLNLSRPSPRHDVHAGAAFLGILHEIERGLGQIFRILSRLSSHGGM